MNLQRFLPTPVFSRFSKKLEAHIQQPRNFGSFKAEEAESHEMRLVLGEEGSLQEGVLVRFYLIVDENDGVIADAKFQAFGPPALIGAADVLCELLLRKSYAQAQRITAELIDRHVRDRNDKNAFPEETACLLNKVLDAIEKAAEQCADIPFQDLYVASPVAIDSLENTVYPYWEKLSVRDQVAVVEDVIAKEIRPYVELDEGGVEVSDIIDGKEVVIIYQGSCTSCYSAVGSTLTAIQQILRSKIHPDLVVTPDTQSLSF